MPPVKDFREIKLKSQVIASIFLFFYFETIAMTGYARNKAATFRRGSQNNEYYRASRQTMCGIQKRSGFNY